MRLPAVVREGNVMMNSFLSAGHTYDPSQTSLQSSTTNVVYSLSFLKMQEITGTRTQARELTTTLWRQQRVSWLLLR
jgi:hypothetical protein